MPMVVNFPLKEENDLPRLKRLGEDEAGYSFHGEGNQMIAGKRHCFLGFIYVLCPPIFTHLLREASNSSICKVSSERFSTVLCSPLISFYLERKYFCPGGEATSRRARCGHLYASDGILELGARAGATHGAAGLLSLLRHGPNLSLEK